MGKYIDSDDAYEVLSEYFHHRVAKLDGAIREAISKVPSANVVARDCFNQVLWENDVMRDQLATIGKGLGAKMDDVRPVVFCKDCKSASINENHPDRPLICGLTKMCGTTKPEWFCADGERKGE